jgi:hypothetical protein
MTSLENIENFKNNTHFKREDVLSSITQQAKIISAHLTRRRSFSSIPAIGALVGSSTNAWLLKDIGWAARNIYCKRRIDFLKASQPPASVEKSA